MESTLSSPVRCDWDELISEWITWSEVSGMSVETIRARRTQARHLSREVDCDPCDVSTDMLIVFFSRHEWKHQTMNAYRANLGSFFARLVSRGIMKTNPVDQMPKVRVERGLPRPCPEDGLAEALRKADKRTGLMVRLGAECGLRRSEIACVRGEDVTRSSSGWILQVHGKGRKDRYVPLSDDLAIALTEHGDGWVFPSSHGEHLNPRYVSALLNRVLPAGFGPHSLRHRFASRVYAATGDILMVSTLLGHSSVSTTQIYCAIPDSGLRRAADAARLSC